MKRRSNVFFGLLFACCCHCHCVCCHTARLIIYEGRGSAECVTSNNDEGVGSLCVSRMQQEHQPHCCMYGMTHSTAASFQAVYVWTTTAVAPPPPLPPPFLPPPPTHTHAHISHRISFTATVLVQLRAQHRPPPLPYKQHPLTRPHPV